MNPPTLSLPCGELVPLSLEHAESLQRHADDELVWQTLFEGFPRPYTLAEARAWCGGGWRGAGHVWGIAIDGEVIGCVGVRQDAGWLRCNAEVGYWIGRRYWGRGITTQALRAAADWAFASTDELTRLYAPIFDWNAASQAVVKKAGFEFEGRLPFSAIKAGKVISRVVYGRYRPR
jgi:ribosomal-protein-alanine N-acetyltransferase